MTPAIAMLVLAVSATVLPVPLDTPPFDTTPPGDPGSAGPLKLTVCLQNGWTDYENWFNSLPGNWPGATFHNGGVNDAIRGDIPPRGIPEVITTPGEGVFHLHQTVNSKSHRIAMYGLPPNRFDVVLEPRLLALHDNETLERTVVFDFLAYGHHPEQTSEEEMEFTFQALKWAEAERGILYVSNAHRTYSANSGGSTGYLTAIDLATLEVLWRTPPLVSNGENFLLLEDMIVTGYGFTDEEDYVYLLDRETGEVLQRVSVPTAPEYFHILGNTLNVRCAGHDCVFSLEY